MIDNTHSLKFTTFDGKYNLFIFNEHEYPESLPLSYTTKLNEIQYPESHRTNQIIGTYIDDIEWSGTFKGSYFDGIEFISAKERSDELKKLMGKVITVHYAIGGFAGDKINVIFKNFKRNIKNYYDVDYTITLAHHEPQTRVTSTETLNISIPTMIGNAMTNMNKAVTVGKGATAAAAKSHAGKIVGKKLADKPVPIKGTWGDALRGASGAAEAGIIKRRNGG